MRTQPQPQHKPVYFDRAAFAETLQPEAYKLNKFVNGLLNRSEFPFDRKDVEAVVNLYLIGTTTGGAVTFPYIDRNNNIRTVQAATVNEQGQITATESLHSVNLRENSQLEPDWLSAYNKQSFTTAFRTQGGYFSCLFGDHLLSKYSHNPIMVVQSPTAAIYGTLYFGLPYTPKTPIWLAVGNKTLSFEKLKPLQGREVIIFPDPSTVKDWEKVINECRDRLPGTVFKFSDLLERSGVSDLADVLTKQDWKLYRRGPQKAATPVERVQPAIETVEPSPVQPFAESVSEPVEQPQQTKEIDWGEDLNQLEAFFSGIEIPVQPLRLDKCSTIINPRLFILSHLSILKSNNGNKRFFPYLSRLQEYQNILKTTKKIKSWD